MDPSFLRIRSGLFMFILLAASFEGAARAEVTTTTFASSTSSTSITIPSTTTTTEQYGLPNCGNWTVGFRIESASAPVGALFYTVNHPFSPGWFVGEPKCSSPLDHVPLVLVSETNDREVLIGLSTEVGIPALTEFVTCTLYGTHNDAPVAEDFDVTVEHARGTDGEPVEITSSVSIVALTESGQCEGECGDGVVSTTEHCDDGNSASDDGCAACFLAFCGDGLVRTGVENCDDGNSFAFDGCPYCQPASCGDGFLRAGIEICDDGNQLDDDDCSDCLPARCGDGDVQPFEQCDDGDTVSGDECSRFCAFERSCGNPIPDGSIVTSDALAVLRRSVGLATDCPSWACDVNESGAVNVTDALAVLRESVSPGTSLHCARPTSVVLRFSTPAYWEVYAMRSVSGVVDYSLVQGELDGEGPTVECEATHPGFAVEFDDDDSTSTLEFEIDYAGGQFPPLPRDLIRCSITSPQGFSSDEFRIPSVSAKQLDGSSVSGLTVEVLPD
jgi:cysteine-rich repeat protein